MKRYLPILVCLLLSLNLISQDTKFRPFKIGFGLPMSKNDVQDAKEYTNAFSINLFVGVSKNERSMALSGLGNIISNDATGLQIAGLFNHIGNNGYGLAVAGLSNSASGSYYGLQVGGLFNSSKEELVGAQVAGLTNVTGDVTGLQVAGLANVTGDVKCMQVAGLANVTGSGFGLQVAGLANVTGDVAGLQVAGLANVTGGMTGMQVAGAINCSDDVMGWQFAGLTNCADDVKGLQLAGLVNSANTVKGVQFAGLLNIAKESNFPIAFINIIKEGKMGVALSYDMLNNMVLSFRSGGKYTYGILGVGYNNLINDGSKIVAEAGYGIHIPINSWFEINNEIKAVSVGFSNDKSCYNLSYLLAPSFTFWNHFNVFGGASFNCIYSNYVDSNELMPKKFIYEKNGSNHKMFIGYQIGLQYIF